MESKLTQWIAECVELAGTCINMESDCEIDRYVSLDDVLESIEWKLSVSLDGLS